MNWLYALFVLGAGIWFQTHGPMGAPAECLVAGLHGAVGPRLLAQIREHKRDEDVQRACVDLNTASYEELQRIIHIGPQRAEAIIKGRPWSSVDELTRISGIAEKRMADIRAQGLACVR